MIFPTRSLLSPLSFKKTMLQRWCKPGGTLYDVTAGVLEVALAARELGMTYIAAQKSKDFFEVGEKRIRDMMSVAFNSKDQSVLVGQKRQSVSEECDVRTPKRMIKWCGVGDHCRFLGTDQPPTDKCHNKNCVRVIQNLCDYRKFFPRPKSRDSKREAKFSCSLECLNISCPLETRGLNTGKVWKRSTCIHLTLLHRSSQEMWLAVFHMQHEDNIHRSQL